MSNAGHVNLEKIKKIQEGLKNRPSGKSNEYLKFEPKEGNNIIRVLPPFTGKDLSFKVLGFHYISETKKWICPKVLENGDCPVCDAVEKLSKSSLQDSKDLANAFMVQEKAAVAIVDRSDSQVKVWITSPKIYRRLIQIWAEWEQLYPDSPDFTDPEAGRDLNLKFDKSKKDCYSLDVIGDKKPIVTDAVKLTEILEQIPDLDPLFRSMGYDKLAEKFSEFEEGISTLTKDIPVEKKSEPAKETPKDEKPKCYGKEFDTNDDECLSCSYLDECNKITLELKRKKIESKPEDTKEPPKEETKEEKKETVQDIIAKSRAQREGKK